MCGLLEEYVTGGGFEMLMVLAISGLLSLLELVCSQRPLPLPYLLLDAQGALSPLGAQARAHPLKSCLPHGLFSEQQ